MWSLRRSLGLEKPVECSGSAMRTGAARAARRTRGGTARDTSRGRERAASLTVTAARKSAIHGLPRGFSLRPGSRRRSRRELNGGIFTFASREASSDSGPQSDDRRKGIPIRNRNGARNRHRLPLRQSACDALGARPPMGGDAVADLIAEGDGGAPTSTRPGSTRWPECPAGLTPPQVRPGPSRRRPRPPGPGRAAAASPGSAPRAS